MKLFESYKNIVEKIGNLSEKDLNAWFSVFMVLIIVDLFGLYWYLGLKKLGSALLIILIFMFALLLFFSKKNSKSKELKGGKNKMPEEKQEETVEEEDMDEEEDMGMGNPFDMSKTGLPSSEEMQKRLNDELGTGFDF